MKICTIILLIYSSITFANKLAFALEKKPVMNLELAKKMADACEAKKSTTEWRPLNIAIVDSGADLILFRRQDGAFLGSIDIAINKAVSGSQGIMRNELRSIFASASGKPVCQPVTDCLS